VRAGIDDLGEVSRFQNRHYFYYAGSK